MTPWIIIWLIFWISGIGLPLYLFKKHQITFHQKSWQHTLYFILGVWGLLASLSVHLSFWLGFHYMLSQKNFLNITPIKT